MIFDELAEKYGVVIPDPRPTPPLTYPDPGPDPVPPADVDPDRMPPEDGQHAHGGER